MLLLPTRSAGDGAPRAREAAEAGAAAIGVAGGDGTLRDVAHGLVTGGHSVPVALIAAGTGNDMARALGLPGDLGAQVSALTSGRELALDTWLWNGQVFVLVAGLGLDAAVAEAVNRRFRGLGGKLAYILAFLAVFPRFQPFQLRVEDGSGGYEGKVWLAAFANAPCYGGGMQIAPNAEMTDGRLDLVIIEAVSRLELLMQFPGLFSGRHIRHPRVKQIRLAEAEVFGAGAPVSLDGETGASAAAALAPGPLKLRVLLPKMHE